MSSRVLALTLAASVATTSMAFAGETLAQSGARIIQGIGQGELRAAVTKRTRNGLPAPSSLERADGAVAEVLLAQEQPVLSKNGMSKKTKFMIYAAIGAGFALTAYTIDHNVLNITPSTLGTRKD